MEEFFLHRWDDLDDITHACRHLAAGAAHELVGAALPLIVTAAAALIGGAATLLLAHGASAGLIA